MDEVSLRDEIKRLRKEIRWHRDQLGDYRCWLDDDKLYKALPNGDGIHCAPPPEEFRRLCEEFWQNRQRPDEPMVNNLVCDSHAQPLAIATADDADLNDMSSVALKVELKKIADAIFHHHDVPRSERRWEHDKALYLVLPEKRLAVWQLPERSCFLESCEHFNASCQQHPTKLHAWELPDETDHN
jgi:hypothetical protein